MGRENIEHSEAKYKLQRLVPKILDDSITTEEVNYFKKWCVEFDDAPFYKVTDADIKNLVRQSILVFDNDCNLNWIDTSAVTNMDELFNHTEFNGDISMWDTHNVRSMR